MSKQFIILLAVLVIIIITLGAFKTGEFIGERKAGYSYRWGENYHRMFGGPRGGWLKDFSGGDFLNSHGIFGVILKIDSSTLIVKSKSDTEQTVVVAAATIIRRGRDTVALTDLKPDTRIVIIGSPNTQGQIEAKFIRVFETVAAAAK